MSVLFSLFPNNCLPTNLVMGSLDVDERSTIVFHARHSETSWFIGVSKHRQVCTIIIVFSITAMTHITYVI